MSGPEFTRQLALETPVETPDGGGGVRRDWETLGLHWAEVRASGAIERTLGGVETSVVTHRLTLRWAPYGSVSRPRAHQRLREGKRVYDILGVTEADSHNRYLTVWAREGGLS